MSNLLDKASVLLTPTAYNNGEALCVKPSDGSGDFQFSRNSAATRVNAQGLVENVQILSSNLVQNGDFSQQGAEEVSNGSFSQEGAEQVTSFTNGTTYPFSTFTSLDNNITSAIINSNFAGCVSNSISVTSSQIYKVSFNYTKNSGDDLRVVFSSVVSGAGSQTSNAELVSTSGSITLYLTITSSGTSYLQLGTASGSASIDFSISNLSVREVGQDWDLGTGWSIGEDKVVANLTSSNDWLSQTNVFTSVKIYKVSFEVLDYTSGSINLSLHSAWSQAYSANGVYTNYLTATGVNLKFSSLANNFNGSITNISVKEVGQNWTAKDGVIVSANSSGLVFDNSTGNASGGVFQNIGLSDANKYQMTATMQLLTGASNGTFTVFSSSANGTSQSQIYSGSTLIVGGNAVTETFEFSPATGDVSIQFTCDEANATYKVSNVTAVQVTSDTNLPRINYEGFSYQDALGSEEVVNGTFDDGGSNWSLGSWTAQNNTATINGQSGILSQASPPLVSGKKYKWTFEITEYNSGSVKLYSGAGADTATYENSVGIHTQYFVANGTGKYFYSNSFNGSITNVSVKEYLGQEVVPNSGCGSWLFEPQSTNTIISSNTVAGMNYTGGLTRSDNASISPDSTFNAMIFTPTATTGVHRTGYSSPAGLYAQNDIVTFSGFVKANGYNFVTMGGFFGQEKAVFNISNGTLVSQESNVINTEIVKLTNDWYRVSTTYTFQNSIGNGYLYAGIYVMETETGYAFAADGVSGVYGYGFQAELGTGTSYIPTSGSSVTRNQDVCTNGATGAGLINSTEGVLYWEGKRFNNDFTNTAISLNNGSFSNSVAIKFRSNENLIFALVYSNSNLEALMQYTVSDITDFTKIAISYAENNFALWVNGLKVLSDTSGNIPIGLTNLSFNTGGTVENFFGKTKALAVWPEALSDSELQSLTTI